MEEQFAAARIAWLCWCGDGSPHTVPVWFVHDESGCWVASSPTSRKIASMTQNDPGRPRHRRVATPMVAQARAEVVGDRAQHPRAVIAFAGKYRGFDITAESCAGRPVLLRLSSSRWLLDGSAA